jgi:molybdenum-dependent DNA-binding transcriptional regulator ModE
MGRRARRETPHTREAQHAARDEATQGPTGLHPTLAPKIRLWIVLADQVQFGHGRAQLLRAIDELGSIRKAAAQFGMSYRRAWGHGGTVLTPAGRAFLTQYEAFRAQVDAMEAGELLALGRHRRPRLAPDGEVPAAAVAERLVQLDAAELRELGRRLRARLAQASVEA